MKTQRALYKAKKADRHETLWLCATSAFFVMLVLCVNSLAAYAACGNPTGQKGDIVYNSTYYTLQYCNDTDWIRMGPSGADPVVGGGSYNINAVEFDGTNDLLRANSGLTVSDSNKWTISLWFQNDDYTANSWRFILDSEDPGDMSIDWHGHVDDGMLIGGRNSGGSSVLSMRSTPVTDAGWHHLLVSVDLSDTNKRHIYLDDVSSIGSVSTYDTSGTFDFTTGDYGIGGSPKSGSNRWDGGLADIWIDFGTYIDFSVEANRRKFINASGQAVDLGANGSGPTGSSPEIFMSGATGSWDDNKGTGGVFDLTGTLDTHSSPPPAESSGDISCSSPAGTVGEMIFNWDYNTLQFCNGSFWIDMNPIAAPASGLVGYWKLDETTGTNAPDSGSAGANGTLVSFAAPASSWSPEVGPIKGALAFDGTDDVINIAGSNGNGHAFDFTTGPFTLAAWVKPSAWDGTVIAKRDGLIANTQYQLYINPSGNLYFLATSEWGGSTTTVPVGEWSHVAAVIDASGNPEVFINGQKQAWSDNTGTRPYTFTHRNTNVSIGARYNTYPAVTTPFNGMIDEVRIYNRALTDDEMEDLYNKTSGKRAVDCTSPAGVPGQLAYNDSNNIMQFCNGDHWIGISGHGTANTPDPISVTRVQTVHNSTAANPVSANWGTTPVAGNLLIAIVGHRRDPGDNTLVDNLGSGWTQRAMINAYHSGITGDTQSRRGIAIWSKIATGSETNVTADFGDAGSNLIIQEFNIQNATVAFDVATTNAGSEDGLVTSVSTGTTGATSTDESLVITGAVSRDTMGGAVSWTNGIGNDAGFNGASNISLHTGWAHTTTQGTKESTASWPTGQMATGAIAVFSLTPD